MITPSFSDKWVLAGGKDEAAAELIGSHLGFLAGSIETVRRESGRIAEVLARNADKPCDLEINGGKICENCHRRSDSPPDFKISSGLSNNRLYNERSCLPPDEYELGSSPVHN